MIINEGREFAIIEDQLREVLGKPPKHKIPYDQDPKYAEERRLNGYIAQTDPKFCPAPDTRNVNDDDFFPDLLSNKGEV